MAKIRITVKLIIGSIGALALFLSGCASKGKANYGVQNSTPLYTLDDVIDLSNPKNKNKSDSKVNPIRRQAIEETALTTGAQTALAWRTQQINQQLESYQRNLSQVFNFNAVLIDNQVIPPVLIEGRTSLNLDNPSTLNIVDRTYQIAKQAHFVTTPPNWREYLVQNFQVPESPSFTLLPKTAEERQIWVNFAVAGWENGIAQANTIFAENLARIKQDYVGMILYRKLLAQNIVSPPFVAKADLGITGDSNRIDIDTQVLRITSLPRLNINSEDWESIVVTADDIKPLDSRIEQISDQETKLNTSWLKSYL